MGRKRQSRHDLPQRVYFKHGAYYFVTAVNKWIKLDADYAKAMSAWAQLIQRPTHTESVNDLLDRYFIEVVPHKAERTQKDNATEARYIRAFFGAMALRDVRPETIAQYRDERVAKVRANRELALLSHALGKACEWGLLERNPCREVKRNRERPRSRYVETHELATFKTFCPEWLQRYVDIKYLIGLRKQDMLALRWSDISEDGISILVKKTKTKVRISWTPELKKLLDSIPRQSLFVFFTRAGRPYTSTSFNTLWQAKMNAYEAAGNERFTEHDIRGKTATDADESGQDAQRLLAHQSRKTTERYIKARATATVQPLRGKK